MKIKKIFLISLMSFGFNSIAYADDFFYVGAGAGKTSVDTGVTVGTASLDEDDSGFKVFAGIPLNQYLAIEYFYNYYGEASLSGNNGQTFTKDGTTYEFTVDNAEIEAESWATGFAPVISYPIPLNDAKGIESISPFAKVGVHYWEVDYTVTAGSTNYGTTTEDGWDMLWGLGAQINFDVNGMRFAVRGEFESTVIDDGDLEMFSGSLLYKF